jgi:hypothetical protein
VVIHENRSFIENHLIFSAEKEIMHSTFAYEVYYFLDKNLNFKIPQSYSEICFRIILFIKFDLSKNDFMLLTKMIYLLIYLALFGIGQFNFLIVY